MADRVRRHAETAPKRRVRSNPAVAEFFPGEAARLLGLGMIDYAQLRELFRLARVARGDEGIGRGWSRFSLADLAAVEILVELGGGREALAEGRRLVLGDVQATCVALRLMGFDDPLLQVPLARDGRRILARVDAFVLEPRTGQLVLETAWQHVDAFLRERAIASSELRSVISAERRRVRPSRKRTLPVSDELGTLKGLVAG